jgi:hypothetical protein
MFLVDENARATLNALCEGYAFPVKSGGERGSVPAVGSSRTLIEALETLTFAMSRPDNATIGGRANAVNSTGSPYMSALPNRR